MQVQVQRSGVDLSSSWLRVVHSWLLHGKQVCGLRKGGPMERYQGAQFLSFAFCSLVNVCGYSVLELIGKNDYISLLLKEDICRGQQ